jgi:hypothetical protein
MSTISRLKRRLHRSGVRAVGASALRRTANRVDSNLIDNNSEPKQANEFLAWVRFAVPGMLNEGNVDAMGYAVANMPPGKPVLEIGSFCGLSTVVLSYLLNKHSKTTRFLVVTSGNSRDSNLEHFSATHRLLLMMLIERT